jgi:hypothetical protein
MPPRRFPPPWSIWLRQEALILTKQMIALQLGAVMRW